MTFSGREWPLDPDTFSRIATAAANSVNAELAERLAVAIENLPEDLALLVNAVVWERVSKRELARRLGVHRPEIDKRLGRAFEMIRERMGWTRDAYYETKKVEGLLQATDEYLSDEEARATMSGRSRGDGRRLDAYTLDDACVWEPGGVTTEVSE